MSLLLETIKCKDGKLFNLKYHQDRFDRARKEYFQCLNKIELANSIFIPAECSKGLFRCRITYDTKIQKIEFLPHKFKNVKSLKLIEDNSIDYHVKFSDRGRLNKLYELRDECDDILIVKKGCITDSFTANPIFFDGEKWWTPNTPLLAGTQRAHLIEEGKIFECRITPDNLSKYKKVGLVNALQDMVDMPTISIHNIKK